MYNILICDDDHDIVEALGIYLSDPGYCLFKAYNGEQAVNIVHDHDIHLVLLDIMMPEMDGMQSLKEMRKCSNVPIIFITAKSEDADRIMGLHIGADDYITKPFHPAEVVARVRSQLRRYMELGSAVRSPESFMVGGIELDDIEKKVQLDGQEVSLTPKEYDILKLFIQNPGKVFSPKVIYQSVWKSDPYGAEGTVAVHIRHLREKLEYDPANPRYFKVIWGQGYKMDRKGR